MRSVHSQENQRLSTARVGHEVESSNSTANLFLGGVRRGWMAGSQIRTNSNSICNNAPPSSVTTRTGRNENNDSTLNRPSSSTVASTTVVTNSRVSGLSSTGQAPLHESVIPPMGSESPRPRTVPPVVFSGRPEQPHPHVSAGSASAPVGSTTTIPTPTMTPTVHLPGKNLSQTSSLPSPDPSVGSCTSPAGLPEDDAELPSRDEIEVQIIQTPADVSVPEDIVRARAEAGRGPEDLTTFNSAAQFTHMQSRDSILPASTNATPITAGVPPQPDGSNGIDDFGIQALISKPDIFWANAKMILENHILEARNMTALSETIELPRARLLVDACKGCDWSYLVLHQMYCLYDFAPRELANFPGFGSEQILGFGVIKQLLVDNNRLSGDFLKWCVFFPQSFQTMKDYEPYRTTVQQIFRSLSLLSSRWLPFKQVMAQRAYPPLIEEFVLNLGITSPVLQGVMFTAACRQLYGTKHESLARTLLALLQRNSLYYREHATSDPERALREREKLIQAYKALLSPQNTSLTPQMLPLQGQQTVCAPLSLPQYHGSRRVSHTTAPAPHSMQPPSAQNSTTHLNLNSNPNSNTPVPGHHSSPHFRPCQTSLPRPPLPSANSRSARGDARRATAPVQQAHSNSSSLAGAPANPRAVPMRVNTWNAGQHQAHPLSPNILSPSMLSPATQHNGQLPNMNTIHPNMQQQSARPFRVLSSSSFSGHSTTPSAVGSIYPGMIVPNNVLPVDSSPYPHLVQNNPLVPNTHPTFTHGGPIPQTSQMQTPQVHQAPGVRAGPQQVVPLTPLLPQPGFVVTTPSSSSRNALRVALHQAHLRSPIRKLIRDGPEGEEETELFQYLHSFAVSPKLLGRTETAFCWNFTLSKEDCQRFPQSLEQSLGQRSIRVLKKDCRIYRLRCIKVSPSTTEVSCESWTLAESVWPSVIYIIINGREYQVRRKVHNGKDIPLDITNGLKEGSNEVNFHFVRGPNETDKVLYALAVETLQIADFDQVKSLAQPLRESESREQLQKRLSSSTDDDDLAIVTDSITVGLIDPFMARIFDIPARGRSCLHAECFDLDTFLKTRASSSGKGPMKEDWRCPICARDARPQRLVVDGFLANVLSELKKTNQIDGAKAIEYKASGSWDLKTDKDIRDRYSSSSEAVSDFRSLKRKRSPEIPSPGQETKIEETPSREAPAPLVIELD